MSETCKQCGGNETKLMNNAELERYKKENIFDQKEGISAVWESISNMFKTKKVYDSNEEVFLVCIQCGHIEKKQ